MYKPLSKNLTIAKSDIEGLGLFATEFIIKGTDLGMTHIYDERFEDNYIRLPLGGFFNHSITPNCEIVIRLKTSTKGSIKHLRLFTISDINPGDELTAYYTLYQPK